jgi:membrane protein implicated in regulation of membrane protease activity
MPGSPLFVFWHWWILAVVLIVAEALLPGTFLLWLGIAAGLVGVILLVVPELGWQYQFLIFAAVSVAAIAGWRSYQRRHPIESDQPLLNRRGEQYVGRTFALAEPIVGGQGRCASATACGRSRAPTCRAWPRSASPAAAAPC